MVELVLLALLLEEQAAAIPETWEGARAVASTGAGPKGCGRTPWPPSFWREERQGGIGLKTLR